MSESRPSFTQQEKVLLYKYFEFYRALETGKRKPSSAAQRHFVAVCQGRASAETVHEKTYIKYMQVRKTRHRQQQAEAAQQDFPNYEEESSRCPADLKGLQRPNDSAPRRQQRQAA
jgi:uncharacterized protein YifE (UPF0438 family)